MVIHEESNSLLMLSHTFSKNPASRKSTDTLVALRLAMFSLNSTEYLRICLTRYLQDTEPTIVELEWYYVPGKGLGRLSET